jgi:hypothetical protein
VKCPSCHYVWEPVKGKPRTTGPFSQSAHLHGHLQQIGKELGYSLNEIKAVMKEDCIDWPRHQVVFHGKVYMVPDSEADATTITESAAIEWCHVRAAELGIELIESTQEAIHVREKI